MPLSSSDATALFRRLMDPLFAYVALLDPDGVVLDVNRAPLEAAGLSRDAVLGRPFPDTPWWASDPAARHRLTEAIGQAVRGTTVRYEAVIHGAADRRLMILDLSLSPLKDTDGRVDQLLVCAVDITERRQTEDLLRASETRLQSILDNAVDGIVTIDEQGRIESFNPAAQRMFGYRAREVLGHSVNLLMPPDQSVRHDGYMARYRSTGQGHIIGIGREVEARRKDGTVFPIELAVSETRVGRTRKFTGLMRDITQRKLSEAALQAAHETLHHQAMHDALTGLYNRRHMEISLGQEVRRYNRNCRPLALIMLDIDHFKRFNDTFGHAAGDTLLRGVGRLLSSHIRTEDVACRYGGEEFLLILPEAGQTAAVERAQRLRLAARHLTVTHEGRALQRVSFSLGVAVLPDHGVTVEELLRAADQALYRAKQNGRDRVEVAVHA